MVNPPLKPEPPLNPWGGRTCPSAPGPPARSVHVTRLALARRSETTTKRARDEVPSRNLRISSLPAKVVLRWVMVASSAKNESAASTSWRLRAISKAAITEAGSAVACAVAMDATTPLTTSPATPAPNASHSLSIYLSGRHRHHRHEVALDDRLDLVAAQHALALPVAVGIERHELDEADHVRLAARQLRERDHFDFGEIAHGDDVHLDRRDARIAFELFE